MPALAASNSRIRSLPQLISSEPSPEHWVFRFLLFRRQVASFPKQGLEFVDIDPDSDSRIATVYRPRATLAFLLEPGPTDPRGHKNRKGLVAGSAGSLAKKAMNSLRFVSEMVRLVRANSPSHRWLPDGEISCVLERQPRSVQTGRWSAYGRATCEIANRRERDRLARSSARDGCLAKVP